MLRLPCNTSGVLAGPVSDSTTAKEPADHAAVSKQKKKAQTEKWSQKLSKQTYTHSWMVTSLKGHSGPVSDMGFSPNDKYLVTCAEGTMVSQAVVR